MNVRNVQDMAQLQQQHDEQIRELVATVETLERRVEATEQGQGFLADREPPNIPPFPRALRDIGLLPPPEQTPLYERTHARDR